MVCLVHCFYLFFSLISLTSSLTPSSLVTLTEMKLQNEKPSWDSIRTMISLGRTEEAASMVSRMPEQAFDEPEDRLILQDALIAMPKVEDCQTKTEFYSRWCVWNRNCESCIEDIFTPECVTVMHALCGDEKAFLGKPQSLLHIYQLLLYCLPTREISEGLPVTVNPAFCNEEEKLFLNIIQQSFSNALVTVCQNEDSWFAANVGSLIARFNGIPGIQSQQRILLDSLCFNATLAYVNDHRSEMYRKTMLNYNRNFEAFIHAVERPQNAEEQRTLKQCRWYSRKPQNYLIMYVLLLQELIQQPPASVQSRMTDLMVKILAVDDMSEIDVVDVRKALTLPDEWKQHRCGKVLETIRDCLFCSREDIFENGKKLLRFLSAGPTGISLRLQVAALHRMVRILLRCREDSSHAAVEFSHSPESEILWILTEQYAQEADLMNIQLPDVNISRLRQDTISFFH